MDDVLYFATADEFRRWLEENHERETEAWLGFYKKGAAKSGISNKEAVDEALCFGWIDGIRKKVDDDRYKNRYTPRRPRSNWSAVNIKRMNELIAEGRVHPAGLKAFGDGKAGPTNQYSFEQEGVSLGDEFESQFKANPTAWEFFQSQPPSYRRTATWWVVSAKREETRHRRLATLIDDSANGLRIASLRRS